MKRIAVCIMAVSMIVAVAALGAGVVNMTESLSVRNGFLNLSQSVSSQQTMTGQNIEHSVKSVGTTCQAFTWSFIPGAVWFRNLDPTNSISIGSVTNCYLMKLAPGQCWIGTLSTNIVYAVAQSNACFMETIALEQ